MTQPSTSDPFGRFCDIAVLGICAIALWHGARATAGLGWPPDVDLYRDLGFAQSILDGRPLSDPLYLGERIWYNPLVPALVALASFVSGQPVQVAAQQLGTWGNVLGVLAFYLLARRLLGRGTALLAAAAFVFVPVGRFPAWASATYSPWLFPGTFVQTLFYLGLWQVLRALESGRRRAFSGAGALLGLTFLGHTAPALLLGLLMVGLVLWSLPGAPTPQRKSRLQGLALALLVAFAVSLPYSWGILVHYRLHVVNPEPSRWVWSMLDLQQLDAFLAAHLYPHGLLALLGLAAVLVASRGPARAAVVLWLLAAGSFFGLSYLGQWLRARGSELPLVVPGHHYLLYLKALELLLFAHGLALCARTAAGLLARIPRLGTPRARTGLERGALVLSGFCAIWLSYPIFRTREELTTEPIKAKILRPSDDQLALLEWLRRETRPTDVFLADDQVSLHLLSPVGRKVVAMLPFFSNPFTEWKDRHRLRHEMFSALFLQRKRLFLTLAESAHVRFVVLEGSQAMVVYGSSMDILKRRTKAGKLNVFEVSYEKLKQPAMPWER